VRGAIAQANLQMNLSFIAQLKEIERKLNNLLAQLKQIKK